MSERGLGQLDCRGDSFDSCGGAWRAHSLNHIVTDEGRRLRRLAPQLDCGGDSCESCGGAWRAHSHNQIVSEEGLGRLAPQPECLEVAGKAWCALPHSPFVFNAEPHTDGRSHVWLGGCEAAR